MPTEGKKLCCWVPGTWVTVIAWVQIVLCAAGAITEIVFLTDASTDPSAKENNVTRGDSNLAVSISIVYLLTCIVDVALGFVLLVGNKKRRASFLWIFLILTGITITICTICDIVEGANGDEIYFLSAALTVAFGCFILYVVHLRFREITSMQQGSALEKL